MVITDKLDYDYQGIASGMLIRCLKNLSPMCKNRFSQTDSLFTSTHFVQLHADDLFHKAAKQFFIITCGQ
jgi:hypothetical protein